MIEINVVLYSYKSPHLLETIKRLLSSTTMSLNINVMDQHPLNRHEKFKEFLNVNYIHKFWDNINSPTDFKHENILDDSKVDAKYTLVISDDTMLSDGWAEKCLEFLNGNERIIISGQGDRKAKRFDHYFLSWDETPSSLFSLTNFADRNFIFGHTKTFREVGYPTDVKYLGEEEKLSLMMYEKDIPIYSAPSETYTDLNIRTVENLYCPFSKEHNYNTLIDKLNTDIGADWLSFLCIDSSPIKLFYQVDDVEYDPNALKMVDLGGERYIANTKAIY